MAVLMSGASEDQLTVDANNAARITLYDSLGREISHQAKATFSASGTFTPVATPTDIIKIVGSASKIVRVISVYLLTTNTAAGSQQFFLIRRNSDDTGGTFIAATPVPLDSIDNATATVGHYTANPVLGNSIGNVNIVRRASTVPAPGVFGTISHEPGGEMLPWGQNSIMDRFVTLRGTNQILAVNFAGAGLVTGQSQAYRITWTEE